MVKRRNFLKQLAAGSAAAIGTVAGTQPLLAAPANSLKEEDKTVYLGVDTYHYKCEGAGMLEKMKILADMGFKYQNGVQEQDGLYSSTCMA